MTSNKFKSPKFESVPGFKIINSNSLIVFKTLHFYATVSLVLFPVFD